MTLLFSAIFLFLKFFVLVSVGIIVLTLGLGILLIRELNLILSVADEYEISETIDTEYESNWMFLTTTLAESI